MKKLVIVFLLFFLTTGCHSAEPYQETKFLFDTEVYIEAYGPNAEKAVNKAMEKMAAIDQEANFYSEDSEIALLNQSAGKNAVHLSKDTFELLEKSLEIAELTSGAFDPAVGPFVQIWQTAKAEEVIPSEEKILQLLPLVDYKRVIIDSDNLTAYLPEAGMSIDLGAITKGFAVEKGMKILKEAGIKSAMVRAGGNVYTIGKKANGNSWRVGIRNPLQLDKTIGYIEPINQVVDTSGNYEQSFSINGHDYGHIINPRTGYPVEGTTSCTIIAENPALADALSTAVFVLGHEEGLALIEKTPKVEGFMVSTDGVRYMSSGFEGLMK
jgi:thiamine biosynthesis lipoprotein